ncbi:hypothetical protein MASR1M50_16560 [Burkholderiales bacterium]
MDINSDLGESYGAWRMGDDAAMLDIVTSANVACGFHAGDPAGILDTLKAAAERGVAVGAHVAYPDLVGFGRRHMDPTSRELVADVVYQIGALQGLARAAGTQVRYVKPHGALYNTIAHDARQGDDVITALLDIDPDLTLLALAGSPLIERARARGLTVVAEAFADRAYNDDGTLVSRRLPGAVLHDADARWPSACCAGPKAARCRPSAASRCACRPTRSACMATAPARWRWRGASAPACTRPACRWRPSSQAA